MVIEVNVSFLRPQEILILFHTPLDNRYMVRFKICITTLDVCTNGYCSLQAPDYNHWLFVQFDYVFLT